MDLLDFTKEIADTFESGLYVVRHREGDFKTDRERWVAAAADCGVSDEKDVAVCWKLYVRAHHISEEAASTPTDEAGW